MARLFIGTSGWNYDHWKQFYSSVKRKDWLHCYAERFNTVEVNATFYRLQNTQTFRRWSDETPPHFRFCIKGNRYLTHNKKLNDPVECIAIERERALGLGGKLAVVLWQLPGTFHKHIERLRNFTAALKHWDEARHAIEFRHPSWFDDEVADCLGEYEIANCQSDASNWPMWDVVTTDLVYVRLHGHTRTYISAYSTSALTSWASKIRKWCRNGQSAYVYFDNDAEGMAPRDAKRLMKIIAEV